jgi:hypothetical protein
MSVVDTGVMLDVDPDIKLYVVPGIMTVVDPDVMPDVVTGIMPYVDPDVMPGVPGPEVMACALDPDIMTGAGPGIGKTV